MIKTGIASKCLNIAFIFRTSVGSINSSFTEENISVVKKVTLPDGTEIPYVSGQAMRRYIRDKWQEMGLAISPVHRVSTGVAEQVTATSECNPREYIDDDLFGFMLSKRDDMRKRASPVRVSPAVAFFPFQDDRDLGVRITEEGKKDPTKMMPPFETEVYYNYFICSILVDLERIGVFNGDNYGKNERPKDLSVDERRRRLTALVMAVRDLWGGGKQARFLTDIAPKFVIYTRQSVKKPIFLERVEMQEDETIDVSSIEQTLKDEGDIIDRTVVGVADGFGGIKVGQEIKWEQAGRETKVPVETISEAFDKIIQDATSVIK
jgi:CRISPR-associated protein Cst2